MASPFDASNERLQGEGPASERSAREHATREQPADERRAGEGPVEEGSAGAPAAGESLGMRVTAAIRDIPDYPRAGIVFRDITPLLGDAVLFAASCRALAAPWVGRGLTHVAAIESRGFLFGGPVAIELGAGLVPIRKPGKLPWRSAREAYELEYGTDTLEMHEDALGKGARVLVVDDVLATGGTAAATTRLVERSGARVAGYSFLIELTFLNGRRALGGRTVERVVAY
jgi:adenine phosphoribosyltransferase